MEKQTIIQQIQPNCNNLYQRIKDEARNQHKTHRNLVETTGIPQYTIAKFFSGRLSSPGVYDVAAICIDLGLSLDELMGVAPPPAPPANDTAVEITELKGKLAKAEAEVKLLKERCKIYEAGYLWACGAVYLPFRCVCGVLICGHFRHRTRIYPKKSDSPRFGGFISCNCGHGFRHCPQCCKKESNSKI